MTRTQWLYFVSSRKKQFKLDVLIYALVASSYIISSLNDIQGFALKQNVDIWPPLVLLLIFKLSIRYFDCLWNTNVVVTGIEFSILSMMITKLLLFARFSILLCLEMDTRRRRLLRCSFNVEDCIHKHATHGRLFYLYILQVYRFNIRYAAHFCNRHAIFCWFIIDWRWLVQNCEFTNVPIFCRRYSLNTFYWLKKFVAKQQRL